MNTEKLRSLIRESINEYIKEIDQAANEAAMDARITKCEEAIQMREEKLARLESLEEVKDMVDETKVVGIKKEIKELQKAKDRFVKLKEKMLNKGKKKEVVADAQVEESPVDEADVTAEMNMKDEGMKDEALNESFLKMQKLAGIITEAQYRQKKSLVENEVVNNPTVQNLEKKAFDFFNQPQVVALLKKELNKLSPEEKTELSKIEVQEGEMNNFSSFKSSVGKIIDDIPLNEDVHDAIRSLGGYKKGQEASAVDKATGKILTNLGVANIMSMGFLPSLTAMAIDYFGGTDIVNTVSQALGSGNTAAALSVVAGLIGGGVLWKLGKILQNEKTDDSTPLFN